MLRFLALCLTLLTVTFVLADVCGVRLWDMTPSGLAMQVRSLAVAVKR
jgi:hypothetical protein